MKECSNELIDIIITQLSNAPDGQIDHALKQKIIDCKGMTYPEKYDIIVEISKSSGCKISSFVMELCALDKYYTRPYEKIEKFKIHGNIDVTVNITQEKKDAILERILQYCKDENCVDGETLHQSDECILNAPDVLSDIIDNILKFETNWDS